MIRGLEVGKVVDMNFLFDVKKVDFEVPVLIEIEPDRIKDIRVLRTVLGGRDTFVA